VDLEIVTQTATVQYKELYCRRRGTFVQYCKAAQGVQVRNYNFDYRELGCCLEKRMGLEWKAMSQLYKFLSLPEPGPMKVRQMRWTSDFLAIFCQFPIFFSLFSCCDVLRSDVAARMIVLSPPKCVRFLPVEVKAAQQA